MVSSKIFTPAALTLVAALLPLRTSQGQAPHAVPLHSVRVAAGLARPLFVTAPAGDTSRVFIVEQFSGTTGRIRILDFPSNTLNPTPYLSISPVATANEEGLLGLAFHPNFATNGFFYVFRTVPGGNNQITRYTATAPFMTSTTADPASALAILTIPHNQFSNHNGGWIGFGPDGDLYIGTGDGGSEGDPNGIGQNQLVLASKMLRIDVDSDDFPADATKNYHIPPTNPFVGNPNALPETWFWGLRNPWRDSFDRVTGDFWIGDVGQNAIEEVDFIPAGQGGLNFGWRCMEGNTCTGLSGCTCNSPALTLPVAQYSHTGGNCSITGGYRYRGTDLCGWDGVYFYADYCTGQITSFSFNGTTATNIVNRTAQIAPGAGLAISNVTSWGEDARGELYICDQTGGEVFKVVPGTITDCNGNGIHDGCDIDSGTSLDADNNGIPDECQPTITAYCFGDGSGTACPCGTGAAGNGCPSSVSPNGANLSASGAAFISNDSVILSGSGMPNASTLYFQGTTKVAGGSGATFGDGLRCAGGTVVRLATKTNSAGGSVFPEILDPLLSVRGGILPGSGPTTRTYQAWYRNAAVFCTPATYNLTNGVAILWVN